MAKDRSRPWYRFAVDQKWKCFYCKRQMTKERGHRLSATLEHRLPQSKLLQHRRGMLYMAMHHPNNEVAACNECNNRKGDMPEDVFRKLLGKVE